MTRSFMNPDSDYTPNDMGPPEKPYERNPSLYDPGVDWELLSPEEKAEWAEWHNLKEEDIKNDAI